jgi:hypothetical protein
MQAEPKGGDAQPVSIHDISFATTSLSAMLNLLRKSGGHIKKENEGNTQLKMQPHPRLDRLAHKQLQLET